MTTPRDCLIVLPLPDPVLVGHEVLGTCERAVIGGRDVLVQTPEVPPNTLREWFLFPPPAGLLPGMLVADDPSPWGDPVAFDAGFVKRIVLHVRHAAAEAPSRALQSVERDLRRWLWYFYEWLEALAGQDLNPNSPLETYSCPAPGAKFWREDADGWQSYEPTFEIEHVPTGDVSIAHWRDALDAASSSRRMPLSRALLLAASDARNRGDDRRAIMDLGLAVEIAVKSELARTKPGLKIADCTLGQALDHAKKSGLVLPAEIGTLLKLRNNAVHRAGSPAWWEGNSVFAVASKFVCDVVPLM